MALPLARFTDWVTGQLAGAADMLAIQTQIRDLIGALAFGISGQRAFLPAANPLTVTAPGGMLVTVGGADQLVFLPETTSASVAKVAYSTAAANVTIQPSDPTHARHDLICIQFANVDVDPHTVGVRSGSTVTPTTVYHLDETYGLIYVQGTPSASPVDPATPAGYVALARVLVPATATNIVTGDITILLANVQGIINGYLGLSPGAGIDITAGVISNTGVLEVGGQTGVIPITSADDSISIAVVGGGLDFSVTNPPGSIFRKQVRPAASSAVTLTLPTLPGTSSDIYDLYAQGSGDTSPGGSQTLTGGGAGVTWEAAYVTVPDAGTVGPEPIDYMGTCTGGDAPSVTYSFLGSTGSTGYIGVFSLQATKRP